jgi:hypothetical protein
VKEKVVGYGQHIQETEEDNYPRKIFAHQLITVDDLQQFRKHLLEELLIALKSQLAAYDLIEKVNFHKTRAGRWFFLVYFVYRNRFSLQTLLGLTCLYASFIEYEYSIFPTVLESY